MEWFSWLKEKGWLFHHKIWYFGNVLILYCLFLPRYGINWAEYTKTLHDHGFCMWVTKADWYFIVVASWIDVMCCIVQHDELSCDTLKSLHESWWFLAKESYNFLALLDYPNLLAHFKTNKAIIYWIVDKLPLNSNKKGSILLTKNSSLNPLFLSAWLIAQYSGSLSIGIGLIVTNFPGPITSKK